MSGYGLGTLITFNPWSVGPTVAIEEIARHLEALQIRHVPVVDERRRVVGMISEADLLRARQPRDLTVGGKMPGGDGPLQACEVMTSEVVTISPQVQFRQALGLLLAHGIHALPVVEDGELVGVVSSRDFLRECSYGELPGSRLTLQEWLGRRNGRSLEPLESDASLDEAWLALQDQGVAALPLVKGGCPVGVVTQRAILRARCGGEPAAALAAPPSEALARRTSTPLAQVAEASPILRPGQRLCEAAGAMLQHQVSAVLVVSASHRLLGMVTEDDLLRVLYDALA